MVVMVVLLLCILPFAAGQRRAICPEPNITVVEGDNILLHGYLYPWVNLSTHTVDWTRDNKVVRACRHKHDQTDTQDQFRNRTTFNCKDLDARNVTLLISSAQLNDSGLYKLSVQNLRVSCTVDVTVVKKDEQNRTKTSDSTTSGPPVEEETHPDNKNAAENEAVRPEVVAGAVIGGILAVAVVGGVIIFILVKRGKIKFHKLCKFSVTNWFSWRKQEETKQNNNNYEMENLRTVTTEEDEEQHRAS